MLTRLILASGSPRRRELLKPFFQMRVYKPNIDESRLGRESPRRYVERVALLKWRASAKVFVNVKDPLLSADTIVAFQSRIFGKPKDREEARRILQQLSGRTHRVLTSVCIGIPAKAPKCFTVVTKIKFRKIPAVELEVYLNSKDWQGKAGAYGIQGRALKFTQYISGSLTSVVGLPLSEVLSQLKSF